MNPQLNALIQTYRQKDPTLAQIFDLLIGQITALEEYKTKLETVMAYDEKLKVLKLAPNPNTNGEGHVLIPRVPVLSFPGGRDREGLVAVDANNARFVFYAANNRYYITGTAF